MIHHIKKEDFEREVLSSPIPVIVDFYATWCGPCKAQSRILESIDPLWEGRVKICKCDVDEETELAEDFSIETIPTLLFYKDGKEIGRFSGVLEKEGLKRMLEL